MQTTFLVLGYGVPRDILRDANYRTYCTVVVNTILTRTRLEGNRQPRIIFCGGLTDFFPPYRRHEATEIRRLFRRVIGQTVVKRESRNWRLICEQRSLSTLENLLNARASLRQRRVRGGRLMIFCEATRARRIAAIAPLVFKRAFRCEVTAIDFDTSPLRYLAQHELQVREARALADSRRALRSARALAHHHNHFVQKVAAARAAKGPERNTSLRQSWQEL